MNIYAVARSAGVSASSVSRYINGTASIRPRTAERIRRAIDDLSFKLDLGASALTTGQSGLLGLILPDFCNPNSPEIFRAFEDAATANGFDIIASSISADSRSLEACLIPMIQRRVQGIAVVSQEIDFRISLLLRQRKIPVILMDAAEKEFPVDTIRFDYEAGMLVGLRHLWSLGHKHIALISVPTSVGAHFHFGEELIQPLLQEAIDSFSLVIEESDGTFEGGQRAMQSLLTQFVRPTAAMCLSELCALGAMNAIYRAPLRIPEDVSIVGFNDTGLGKYISPAMTTLELPWSDLATMAIDALLRTDHENCMNTDYRSSRTLRPSLIVRESTRLRSGS